MSVTTDNDAMWTSNGGSRRWSGAEESSRILVLWMILGETSVKWQPTKSIVMSWSKRLQALLNAVGRS
jgi:hypothetical protein